jgi:hypothetical protein
MLAAGFAVIAPRAASPCADVRALDVVASARPRRTGRLELATVDRIVRGPPERHERVRGERRAGVATKIVRILLGDTHQVLSSCVSTKRGEAQARGERRAASARESERARERESERARERESERARERESERARERESGETADEEAKRRRSEETAGEEAKRRRSGETAGEETKRQWVKRRGRRTGRISGIHAAEFPERARESGEPA